MPEPKNPKPRTTRRETTAKQPPHAKVCHIHDKVKDLEDYFTRKYVCVSDEEAEKYELKEHLTEFEGKHYCLFHLPTKEKDIAKFEEIFQARLEKTDKQCAAIEAEFPDDEEIQNEANRERNINYNFSYIWFPSRVNLDKRKFNAKASFISATFSAKANFSKAIFSASADFSGATFSASADFSEATFSADANFSEATFSSYANFSEATFSEYADFKEATFSAYLNFNEATFSEYADFKEATFSESAYFRSATFSAKANFSETTFSEYADFSKAIFSAFANFSGATFSSYASFSEATFSESASFSGATFSESASFSEATFSSDAYFRLATFSAKANFSETTFSASANFSETTFSASANFSKATLSAFADFRSATFDEKSQIFFIETKLLKNLNFNYSIFKGYVAFEGKKGNRLFTAEESLLDLQNARIDDAKKISFHTVRLEPSWFVNTDASEFIFTDCEWYYVNGKSLDVKRELQNLRVRKDVLDRPIFENPNALLTKACWQLADNHEESKSFAKSSLFRQIAHESKRLETPWYFQPFTLHWWYYAFSFYGERWTRAFVMLVLIMLLCGVFYNSPFAYFEVSEKKDTIKTEDPKPKEYYKMNNFEGIIHSLNVAALQRPEPKPAPDSDLTKAVVILETIFAPLQAALLALAIRRKFMR